MVAALRPLPPHVQALVAPICTHLLTPQAQQGGVIDGMLPPQ
jgi:hypothetical protein